MGTTYPICISSPNRSMIFPMITGNIAPPMMDITSNEDAGLVFDLSPAMPSEKIVGNMMDMKNPSPPSAKT
ncbi:MAG: hypothetical protein RLZ76_825, partial [Bacteroidota bacterium]